jgi:hypothetical protein
VISLTIRPFYTRERSPVPLVEALSFRGWSGRRSRKRTIFSALGFEPRRSNPIPIPATKFWSPAWPYYFQLQGYTAKVASFCHCLLLIMTRWTSRTSKNPPLASRRHTPDDVSIKQPGCISVISSVVLLQIRKQHGTLWAYSQNCVKGPLASSSSEWNSVPNGRIFMKFGI